MKAAKAHPEGGWFDAAKAASITGHTPAMLNYLCRTGIIEPTCSCVRGHGKARHYSFGDLVALRLVARLAFLGVSPLKLKEGLRALRERHPEITLQTLPASHIVTNGKHLFLRDEGDTLERILDGQLAFAFVIELPKLRDEVASEILKDRAA
jgi:DNA-binding transcriptional MerR regulator